MIERQFQNSPLGYYRDIMGDEDDTYLLLKEFECLMHEALYNKLLDTGFCKDVAEDLARCGGK